MDNTQDNARDSRDMTQERRDRENGRVRRVVLDYGHANNFPVELRGGGRRFRGAPRGGRGGGGEYGQERQPHQFPPPEQDIGNSNEHRVNHNNQTVTVPPPLSSADDNVSVFCGRNERECRNPSPENNRTTSNDRVRVQQRYYDENGDGYISNGENWDDEIPTGDANNDDEDDRNRPISPVRVRRSSPEYQNYRPRGNNNRRSRGGFRAGRRGSRGRGVRGQRNLDSNPNLIFPKTTATQFCNNDGWQRNGNYHLTSPNRRPFAPNDGQHFAQDVDWRVHQRPGGVPNNSGSEAGNFQPQSPARDGTSRDGHNLLSNTTSPKCKGHGKDWPFNLNDPRNSPKRVYSHSITPTRETSPPITGQSSSLFPPIARVPFSPGENYNRQSSRSGSRDSRDRRHSSSSSINEDRRHSRSQSRSRRPSRSQSRGQHYSPSPRDRQYSPSPIGRPYSPSPRGRPHSPLPRGRPHSPLPRDRPHSPLPRSRPHSPSPIRDSRASRSRSRGRHLSRSRDHSSSRSRSGDRRSSRSRDRRPSRSRSRDRCYSPSPIRDGFPRSHYNGRGRGRGRPFYKRGGANRSFSRGNSSERCQRGNRWSPNKTEQTRLGSDIISWRSNKSQINQPSNAPPGSMSGVPTSTATSSNALSHSNHSTMNGGIRIIADIRTEDVNRGETPPRDPRLASKKIVKSPDMPKTRLALDPNGNNSNGLILKDNGSSDKIISKPSNTTKVNGYSPAAPLYFPEKIGRPENSPVTRQNTPLQHSHSNPTTANASCSNGSQGFTIPIPINKLPQLGNLFESEPELLDVAMTSSSDSSPEKSPPKGVEAGYLTKKVNELRKRKAEEQLQRTSASEKEKENREKPNTVTVTVESSKTVAPLSQVRRQKPCPKSKKIKLSQPEDTTKQNTAKINSTNIDKHKNGEINKKKDAKGDEVKKTKPVEKGGAGNCLKDPLKVPITTADSSNTQQEIHKVTNTKSVETSAEKEHVEETINLENLEQIKDPKTKELLSKNLEHTCSPVIDIPKVPEPLEQIKNKKPVDTNAESSVTSTGTSVIASGEMLNRDTMGGRSDLINLDINTFLQENDMSREDTDISFVSNTSSSATLLTEETVTINEEAETSKTTIIPSLSSETTTATEAVPISPAAAEPLAIIHLPSSITGTNNNNESEPGSEEQVTVNPETENIPTANPVAETTPITTVVATLSSEEGAMNISSEEEAALFSFINNNDPEDEQPMIGIRSDLFENADDELKELFEEIKRKTLMVKSAVVSQMYRFTSSLESNEPIGTQLGIVRYLREVLLKAFYILDSADSKIRSEDVLKYDLSTNFRFEEIKDIAVEEMCEYFMKLVALNFFIRDPAFEEYRETLLIMHFRISRLLNHYAVGKNPARAERNFMNIQQFIKTSIREFHIEIEDVIRIWDHVKTLHNKTQLEHTVAYVEHSCVGLKGFSKLMDSIVIRVLAKRCTDRGLPVPESLEEGHSFERDMKLLQQISDRVIRRPAEEPIMHSYNIPTGPPIGRIVTLTSTSSGSGIQQQRRISTQSRIPPSAAAGSLSQQNSSNSQQTMMRGQMNVGNQNSVQQIHLGGPVRQTHPSRTSLPISMQQGIQNMPNNIGSANPAGITTTTEIQMAVRQLHHQPYASSQQQQQNAYSTNANPLNILLQSQNVNGSGALNPVQAYSTDGNISQTTGHLQLNQQQPYQYQVMRGQDRSQNQRFQQQHPAAVFQQQRQTPVPQIGSGQLQQLMQHNPQQIATMGNGGYNTMQQYPNNQTQFQQQQIQQQPVVVYNNSQQEQQQTMYMYQ